MKLTDFKGTEAIDVLAKIITPISVIVNDAEFQRLIKTKGSPIMNVIKYILNTFPDEILDIYEPLTKEKREDATPIKLIQLLADIANDPELSALFFSQSQTEDLNASGSATENTEENGKA